MKITINYVGQFRNEFHRQGRGNTFSYDGYEILFNYLEEGDPDTELDVVSLCCDYAESDPDTIAKDYALEWEGKTPAEVHELVIEYLEHNSSVCGVTPAGNVVYCTAF